LKIIILISLFIVSLDAIQYKNLSEGWNLHKVYANDQDFSTYTNQDLILHYKNYTWYGVSPNTRYNSWLSDKNIDPLPILHSGVVTAQNKISKDDIESIVATSLDVPGLYTRLAHLGHLYS
jgi:hypothetical protein